MTTHATRAEAVRPEIAEPPEGRTELVTPRTASEMLKGNGINRRLRPPVVAAYARDMAAGDWLETGEPIILSDEGRLLDGQHRLNAVIKSGANVRMLIVRGVSDDAMRRIDTGKGRSVSTGIGLANPGLRNVSNVTAAARLVIAVRNGLFGGNGKVREITASEIEGFILCNPRLVEIASMSGNAARNAFLSPAQVAAALFMFSEVSEVAMMEFYRHFSTGEDIREGDPIHTLRARAVKSKVDRLSVTPEQWMSMLFRTWNAWRLGRQVRRIYAVQDGATIPVPDLI